MATGPLNHWHPLFEKALGLLDHARGSSGHDFPWTFGGGTALMTMYQHRYSKDIDIFLTDPQILGYLTPRLSPAAEALTADYEEGGEWVKLRFPEGEIDFIGTGWLTSDPFTVSTILGREVKVESPAEIIGKKVHHRATTFKARDLFDLATVQERGPENLHAIRPILQGRKTDLLERIRNHRKALEEEYGELDLLATQKTLDDCIQALHDVLK